MKKPAILLAIIILAALITGAFFWNRKDDKTTPVVTTQTTSTPSNNSSSESIAAQQTSQNSISYTNSGFSPATLTVKSGDKVTITNNSDRILQFDSNPHPEHTDNPELNVGVIAPGQSKTITVQTTGTHGYHNHASDDDNGTLTVQ